MTAMPKVEGVPGPLRLADLTPYFSVTVLGCVADDPGAAFDSLRRFLRKEAAEPGRADSVRILSEVSVTGTDEVEGAGPLDGLGFEELYGLARVITRTPSWTPSDAGLVDVEHQLAIALRRNRLVAIHGEVASAAQLARWVSQPGSAFRFVPQDVLNRAFEGDGRMVWTRGTHRRRTTKADTKALGGMRIQDALETIEDGSYALTAAMVAHHPADDTALLRDTVTFSPEKSRVSWKPTSSLLVFLAVAQEVLDILEKAHVAEDAPGPLFPQLAVRETDLNRVRGAFHVSVASPEQLRGEPDTDDDQIARAELLQGAILEVSGEPDSAAAMLTVGRDGCEAGTLTLRPHETTSGFVLTVGVLGEPWDGQRLREVKDAIQDGDLLTIYYESGHAFSGRSISRRNLVSTPFPNLRFEDFGDVEVAREKPKPGPGQSLHDAIAVDGDRSLFAWVVHAFGQDWLLCNDGSGEVADFLHLTDDGTLTAIHVKAANNNSPGRRIAVTSFEEVVSQAEKNIGMLDNDILIDHLGRTNCTAWHEGHRIESAKFIEQLATRVASDRTKVLIVQPHLLKAVHDHARATADAGTPDRDAKSLMLLDHLLHSTRRTVTARWDDLTVIGST